MSGPTSPATTSRGNAGVWEGSEDVRVASPTSTSSIGPAATGDQGGQAGLRDSPGRRGSAEVPEAGREVARSVEAWSGTTLTLCTGTEVAAGQRGQAGLKDLPVRGVVMAETLETGREVMLGIEPELAAGDMPGREGQAKRARMPPMHQGACPTPEHTLREQLGVGRQPTRQSGSIPSTPARSGAPDHPQEPGWNRWPPTRPGVSLPPARARHGVPTKTEEQARQAANPQSARARAGTPVAVGSTSATSDEARRSALIREVQDTATAYLSTPLDAEEVRQLASDAFDTADQEFGEKEAAEWGEDNFQAGIPQEMVDEHARLLEAEGGNFEALAARRLTDRSSSARSSSARSVSAQSGLAYSVSALSSSARSVSARRNPHRRECRRRDRYRLIQ